MTYSVREVAQHFTVGQHTVLEWIHHAELLAVNVARRPGGKPRWRISADSLRAFEMLRSVESPPVPVRRRRQQADAIKFY